MPTIATTAAPPTAAQTTSAQQHPSIGVLAAEDTGSIVNFINGLDSPEQWQRFLRTVTPTQVHEHYATIDWANSIVLAWRTSDGICALAEVMLYDGTAGREAELSLSLRPGWRGRGIGELLLSAAIAAATERGAVRCVMVLTAGDDATPILRRLGGRIDPDTGLAILTR
jgi:GNAT superfamily N-acetyltransferase